MANTATARKIKSTTSDKVFTVFNTIIMVLFVVITLYPVLNTLAVAFNDGTDALRGGIHIWPRMMFVDRKSVV